ncbi:MAG: VOC family protein [Proteobacteria bacterium]|nr:VOC family protein [Pseudomonadota bacterium]
MKLGYTILYVKNVSETLNFFTKAFGLEKKFLHESGDYGELSTGDTTLAFASFELAESNGVGFVSNKGSRPCSEMEIALVTKDVDSAFHRAISEGAINVVSPVVKPWGQAVAYVREPDGFLVEICSPIEG